ncbi:sodium:dicarboxylate symporter, partial [Methylobacterium indicum]
MQHATPSATAPGSSQPWYKVLYIQVLIAIALGVLLGYVAPDTAKAMKWLGDAFIALIKMMIAPIIFCTIVHGIASIGDLKKVGRVGLKALVYFEVVSSLALVIGVIVGEIVRPGAGFGATAEQLDAKAVAGYVSKAQADSTIAHIMAIIPKSYFDAFAGGDLLQILLISVLTGVVITGLGERGKPATHAIEAAGEIFFRIIGMIVKLAPIGAFGAMAYTIGQYGIGKLGNLAGLVATFYLTSLLFVLVVLGLIARFSGFSIIKFLAYIKDELLIVLGTSSSETVLPHMMQKMKRLGASDSVVGLVIPTGYSFNLDGTNIYMTLATLFLAQAVGADLSFGQYATIIAVAMLTSKGASGVTGAGFITLAATLAAIPGNPVPVAAMALILGID